MRLLDVGCGWGGMVRHAAEHYGVTALGVTLSAEQAEWAQGRSPSGASPTWPRSGTSDYRDVTETGFDAVSSIGLTEHIGASATARLLPRSCATTCGRAAGCSTTASPGRTTSTRGDPAARLHQPLRLPRRRADRLRRHRLGSCRTPASRSGTRRTCASTTPGPARPGAATSSQLGRGVAEVGEGRGRVWGLYLAGSRLGFERNEIQLHQVLAVKTDAAGGAGMPAAPRLRRLTLTGARTNLC